MIDLLRHGQTEAGSGFFGRTDVKLSAQGFAQMQQAVAMGQWDQLISSPLQRCRLFAEHLSRETKLPLTLVPDLQELDFGDWEGLNASQVMAEDAEALAKFWRDPYAYTPPNAEPMSAFASRVFSALDQLKRDFAGQRLLVITHAGVMRLLLAAEQGLAREALLEVVVEHASLHRLNCHS